MGDECLKIEAVAKLFPEFTVLELFELAVDFFTYSSRNERVCLTLYTLGLYEIFVDGVSAGYIRKNFAKRRFEYFDDLSISFTVSWKWLTGQGHDLDVDYSLEALAERFGDSVRVYRVDDRVDEIFVDDEHYVYLPHDSSIASIPVLDTCLDLTEAFTFDDLRKRSEEIC